MKNKITAKVLFFIGICVFLFHGHLSFAQTLTDSNLPIVIINTDIDPETNEPIPIVDDPRVLGTMKIIKRLDGRRNFLSDQDTPEFLDYNGRMNIEFRGSSSQDLPKKPYGLTTLKADNVSNNNVSLLGMPSENDWVLNSLAFDPSLIRDFLSYNLARQMGNYAPRTQYCEVVVNGEYKGLYILQEKIKADGNRVNIVKITDADNSLPDVTGGYITKADKTTGGDPVAWVMSNSWEFGTEFIHELPKPENVTSEQHNYIYNCFQNLESTTAAGNVSLINGYPSVIDVPSFVDFVLSNEFASNADAYQFSTFYHKDRNGKLRAGPIWDFNLTYGNDLFDYGYDRSHYDVWQIDVNRTKFWKDLFDNTDFKCYLSKRWNGLTQNGQPFSQQNVSDLIDNTVNLIAEAIVRENEKWGTIPNHSLEITNLKAWLLQRENWITQNLGSFSACSDVVLPSLVINKINYNPASDDFASNDKEFIEIKNTGSTAVDLAGIYLRELGISYQFPTNGTIASGQSAFIASNPEIFQLKYGFAAFGQFTRNLSNSSQRLVLADGFGNVIDQVQYSDSAPWPDADGNGSFLQLIDTALDNSLASSWMATDQLLSNDAFAVAMNVSVYPNPVTDVLSFSSNNAIQKISVFDVYGKLLQSKTVNANVTKIDFSGYAKGMYLVQMVNDSGSKTEKVIKL